MDDWCDQQESVPDGDRIYRCSKCGKRLHPRKIFGSDGELADYLANRLENLRPEEASAARVLRELVKNQRLG